MKINAVKNLMQSLEFNREDKMALLEILKQELGMQGNERTGAVNEIGEEFRFPMLYADGIISKRLRTDARPMGIVVESNGQKFAIYCQRHDCGYCSSRDSAEKYAFNLSKIDGKSWKLISERHCRAINHASIFRAINEQLSKVGWRKIVESREIEVLTSDGTIRANIWEIWFVMDL